MTKFRLSDHNLEIAIPKKGFICNKDYLNCFSDIEDPDPSDSIIEDQPVTFDIVEDGTNILGWHRHFIGKAGGSNLHFYKLIPALMKEARSVG